MAKRVRELTAFLESEKTKNKQLSKNFKEIETQLIHLKNKKTDFYNDDEDEDMDSKNNSDEEAGAKLGLKKENKELKEKLNQASHKMMEYKSQTECLKLDLKRAHKVIYYHKLKHILLDQFIFFHFRPWKKRLGTMST